MNTELTGRSVPVPKQSERKSAFVDRYGAVFGRQQGLMLKMSGLSASEARGDGAWVEDTQGGRWLDFGSFGVHLLGHSHSGVVSALVEQIQRFGLSTKILSNEPIVLAAERLLVMAGPEKDKVIFGNTGSEVVEAALKLARIVTGRRRVIAFEQAYHGRTAAALSVSHGYMRHAGLLTEGDVVFVQSTISMLSPTRWRQATSRRSLLSPYRARAGYALWRMNFFEVLATWPRLLTAA